MAIDIDTGTFLGGTGRRVVDRLIDSRRILGGPATAKHYFTARQNTTVDGQTLTTYDTNMTSNRVPANEKWYLWGIGVSFYFGGSSRVFNMATLQELYGRSRNAQIKLSVSNQEIWRMPLVSLFGSMLRAPVLVDSATASASMTQNVSAGGEIAFEDATGAVPVVLEADTNFELELVGLSAADSERVFGLRFYFPRTKIVLAAS